MWVAFLLASTARAQSSTVLELCLSTSQDFEALTTLRRWLPRLELRALPQDKCVPSQGAYLARFSAQNGRAHIVVTAPDRGLTVERTLPWLSSVEAPLTQLAQQGRLSEFSVLLEGLTTELSLEKSAAKPQVGATAQAALTPGAAPTRGAPSTRTEAARANESSNRAKPTGGGAATTSGAPFISWPSSASAIAQPSISTPAAPALEAAAPAPPGARPIFLADVGVTPRWRTPGLWTVELGLAVGVGPVRLQAAWAPTARWLLAGRPLSVDTLSLALSWRPRLWEQHFWALDGSLGVATERLQLRRLELEGAKAHIYWDLGLRAGLSVSRAMGSFVVALQTEGTWNVTSRLVTVPDGPSAVLNRFTVGGSLTGGWRW